MQLTEIYMNLYQFHSPKILKKYSFFSIGKGDAYFDSLEYNSEINERNKESVNLLASILKNDSNRAALVLSGSFIELLQSHNPQLIKDIKVALSTSKITLLGSTYNLSLASLFSVELFNEQVKRHKFLLKKVFDYEPKGFVNTSAIYFDDLANLYKNMGFEFVVVPYSSWHLNKRNANQLFFSKDKIIKLILMGHSSCLLKYISAPLPSFESSINDESNQISFSSILAQETSEKYLVPQPIVDSQLINANSLWDNPLQKSVINRIKMLEKKVLKRKDENLLLQLSTFTSVDYFKSLTQSKKDKETRPYDYYISLMNILSDFEIINRL